MTTNAFAGLGSSVYIEQRTPSIAPTAKTIIAITKANPGVITSTAHGLLDGMIVTIAGVGSMFEINGTYYVAGSTANTFSLITFDGVALNTTAFSNYNSGGTATPKAYLAAPETRTLNFADTQTPEIDVTTLLSTSKEYLLGLQDAGEFSFEMNYVPFDRAIVEMRLAKADALVRSFIINFPNDATFAFRGFVKSVPFQTDYQTAVSGSATIKITGSPIWMP
jgi:hypothetical protein